MLTAEVKRYIEVSVLCWLATCDNKGIPNVSPKEVFTHLDDEYLIIANIISPVSVKNIKVNPNVCVSFIEVFIQKGYKLNGVAEIIEKDHKEYNDLYLKLTGIYSDRFPIKSVIKIKVDKISEIKAPSYFLFTNTTEEKQIENALSTYKVKKGNEE